MSMFSRSSVYCLVFVAFSAPALASDSLGVVTTLNVPEALQVQPIYIHSGGACAETPIHFEGDGINIHSVWNTAQCAGFHQEWHSITPPHWLAPGHLEYTYAITSPEHPEWPPTGRNVIHFNQDGTAWVEWFQAGGGYGRFDIRPGWR